MDNKYLVEQSKLYKYVSLEGAKSVVSNSTLKFTNSKDFNDPFDTDEDILEYDLNNMGIDAKEDIESVMKSFLKQNNINKLEQVKLAEELLKKSPYLIEAYKLSKQKLIKDSRALCFSLDDNNILLWSHYADKHNGICLEFDLSLGIENILTEVEIQMLGKVDYERSKKINYLENKMKAICKLYLTKISEWNYENEVRMIITSNEQYQKFNKQFLTGIIFGCRVSFDSINDFKTLCYNNGFHNVKYRKAVKNPFELTIEDC